MNKILAPGGRATCASGPVSGLLLLGACVSAVLVASGVSVKAGVLLVVLAVAHRCAGSMAIFARKLRFVALFSLVLLISQALSVHVGRVVLFGRITDQGLLSGAEMALRFLVILSSSLLFVAMTDPDELTHALIRAGIPYRFGFVLSLAVRFVPFFSQELARVREAQRLRGISFSYRRPSELRRAIYYTFVPVLVSGLVRVDSVTMSMKGRAFGVHQHRTWSRPLRWTRTDTSLAVLSAVLLAASIVARRFQWM